MARINEDLLRNDGEDNFGGVSSHLYYAYWSEIEVFPKSDLTKTTYKEVGTITNGFTFKAGGKWNKFYATPESAGIETNMVGESRDGKSYENKFSFSIPKLDAALVGFMRKNANSRLVFMIMDNNGFWRIMGDWRMAAEISEVSGGIGKKVADFNNATFTIKSQFEPAPIYAGTLPDGTTPVYN